MGCIVHCITQCHAETINESTAIIVHYRNSLIVNKTPLGFTSYNIDIGTTATAIVTKSTNENIYIGTFPVVALMTGDAITRLTHELEICNFNSTNETEDVLFDSSDPCAHPECEQMQVDIAVTLSVLVGILMVSCV